MGANAYNSPLSQAQLNDPAQTTILKYYFYEDYAFASGQPFDPTPNNTAFPQSYPTSNDILPVAPTQRLLGAQTGKKVRVLGTGNFLTTTLYYNEDGLPCQSLAQNITAATYISTLQRHRDGSSKNSLRHNLKYFPFTKKV